MVYYHVDSAQNSFGGVVMDLGNMLLAPLSSFLAGVLKVALGAVFVALACLFILFCTSVRGNPFTLSPDVLRKRPIKSKLFDFMRWVLIDFKERDLHLGEFREFGFTFYVGRQGAGKTSAMVEYLNRMHKKYPNCVIVSNFQYEYADFIMCDWKDLLNVRNGTDGVIFAIDEIHSEYSAASWKDVPENLLSEVSQQRKQRVKIVATSQFFGRVAKPLREQANDVVVCSCFLGRLIRAKVYDAMEYSSYVDNPITIKKALKAVRRYSFVSSDMLRNCFDTYEKINRMRKLEARNRKDGKS